MPRIGAIESIGDLMYTRPLSGATANLIEQIDPFHFRINELTYRIVGFNPGTGKHDAITEVQHPATLYSVADIRAKYDPWGQNTFGLPITIALDKNGGLIAFSGLQKPVPNVFADNLVIGSVATDGTGIFRTQVGVTSNSIETRIINSLGIINTGNLRISGVPGTMRVQFGPNLFHLDADTGVGNRYSSWAPQNPANLSIFLDQGAFYSGDGFLHATAIQRLDGVSLDPVSLTGDESSIITFWFQPKTGELTANLGHYRYSSVGDAMNNAHLEFPIISRRRNELSLYVYVGAVAVCATCTDITDTRTARFYPGGILGDQLPFFGVGESAFVARQEGAKYVETRADLALVDVTDFTGGEPRFITETRQASRFVRGDETGDIVIPGQGSWFITGDVLQQMKVLTVNKLPDETGPAMVYLQNHPNSRIKDGWREKQPNGKYAEI